jgi:hypothetical protein
MKSRSWDQLLRAGVRGATVNEVMKHIHRVDPFAVRLQPIRLSSTWAGIWYAAKRERVSKVRSSMTRKGIALTERLVNATRVPLAPYLNIAVVKGKRPE